MPHYVTLIISRRTKPIRSVWKIPTIIKLNQIIQDSINESNRQYPRRIQMIRPKRIKKLIKVSYRGSSTLLLTSIIEWRINIVRYKSLILVMVL